MSTGRKKILILAEWYEPGFMAGGPIQSVKNFVSALCQRYEIYVVASDRDLGSTEPYRDIGAEKWIRRSPGVQVFYSSKLSKPLLQKLIAETAPDFIYLNSLYSYRFAILPLRLLRRGEIKAKIVLSPRGMLRASAVAHKAIKKKPFLALFRLLGIPQRIYFHATDEQEQTDIRKHFPKAGPVTVIPNFSPPLPPEPAPLEKFPGRLNCVFIGRIMDIKNLAFFTGLLPGLSPEIRVNLSIYGSVENETYWTAIKSQIQKYPDNIRATYHGPIPHSEVRGILDRHHLFILPTRGENFGHAIFEAFSAGRPVLISDKTPWRELEQKAAGWDLPLDQPAAWVNAIVAAADWTQSGFDQCTANAFRLAKAYQASVDLVDAYEKLFA